MGNGIVTSIETFRIQRAFETTISVVSTNYDACLMFARPKRRGNINAIAAPESEARICTRWSPAAASFAGDVVTKCIRGCGQAACDITIVCIGPQTDVGSALALSRLPHGMQR